MTADPFKNAIRRYISASDYWQRVDDQQEKSLCGHDLESVITPHLQKRIEDLVSAEQDGFVFEGELAWLQDFVEGGAKSFRLYDQWVRHILDFEVFDQPLQWGIYPVTETYTPNEFRNVWSALMDDYDDKILPQFCETPKLEDYQRWLDCGREFAVFGPSQAPSPQHLVKLFEVLHNLPYYFESVPECFRDEFGLSEIIVANQRYPHRWQLEVIDDYGGCIDTQFDGRQLVTEIRPDYKTIRSTILANLDDDCPYSNAISTAQRAQMRPGNFEQLAYESLKHLPNDIAEYVKENIWRDYDWFSDGSILSHATLTDLEIRCLNCDLKRNVDLMFHWGTSIGYPSYKLGDAIHWHEKLVKNKLPYHKANVGNSRHKEVFVIARSVLPCFACGDETECLIRIVDNRIVELANDRLSEIEYTFQTPFITSQLIPFEKYEADWLRALVEEKANSANSYMFDVLRQELSSCLTSKTACWLLFRNRDLWSDEEYARMIATIGMEFHFQLSDKCLGKQTPIKSCGLLRNVPYGKGSVDLWFTWGSLLDFPEYEIGDEIRWSDYSMGYLGASNVIANGNFGRIVIEENVIKEVVLDSEKTYEPMQAFVEGKPFKHWPDKEFLRTIYAH